jgi:hypothetical protein
LELHLIVGVFRDFFVVLVDFDLKSQQGLCLVQLSLSIIPSLFKYCQIGFFYGQTFDFLLQTLYALLATLHFAIQEIHVEPLRSFAFPFKSAQFSHEIIIFERVFVVAERLGFHLLFHGGHLGDVLFQFLGNHFVFVSVKVGFFLILCRFLLQSIMVRRNLSQLLLTIHQISLHIEGVLLLLQERIVAQHVQLLFQLLFLRFQVLNHKLTFN